MLDTASSTYCISPAGSLAQSCCIFYLEGKPAALMRIVSNTPHALSCWTARMGLYSNGSLLSFGLIQRT